MRAGTDAGFLQTTYWADLIRLVEQGRPLYLEVWQGNDMVASQMLIRRIPFDRNRGKARQGFREFVFGSVNGWLDLCGGPLFHVPEHAMTALMEILGWITTYAERERLRGIQFHGFPPCSKLASDPTVSQVFKSFGFNVSPWATYLVDLTREDDAMWSQMEHAGRKAVKKAMREGVRVVRIDSWEEFVEKYYIPYGACAQKSEQQVLKLPLARMGWDHPSRRFYRYYCAVDTRGTTLATLGMYFFNGVATEIMSALTAEAFEKKVPAQDLLHWEMFLEAKRMGCHTFDLAGVNPAPATPKEEGIRRFKAKWGGRYVEYYRFSKEYPNLLKRAARVLKKRLDSGESDEP